MYYNKSRIEEQLEEGISDPASAIEDLSEFLGKVVDHFEDGNIQALEKLLSKWEGRQVTYP